jgi:uncharacterized delta-60 repeat protein
VVLAGQTDLGFDPVLGSVLALAVVRYNVDGTLDGGFGSGGVVKTRVGNSANANAQAVKVQPDGKIVAAGYVDEGTVDTRKLDFVLVRYNRDGSIDRTFGHAGTTITDLSSGDDYLIAIALQPDGKIVAAGIAYTPQGPSFALVRYKSNGQIDKTFGNKGTVMTAVGPYASGAFAVALQPDGKIVAAGYSSTQADGSGRDSALVRYLPDGSLDNSFGGGTGIVVTAVDSGHRDQYYGVAIDSSNHILAAGQTGDGSSDEFTLARYTPAGDLDATFGNAGIVTTAVQTSAEANGLVIQPDGRIVLGGGSFNATTNSQSFAAARYEP